MSLIRKLFGQNRHLIKLTTFVHGKTHRNVVPIYFLNDYRNDGATRSNAWKFLAAFASGYVAFKLFDENFPSVQAAAPFVSMTSRRKQFNFVADVVEVTAPAVVYIEIKDTRRTEFFTGKPITISNGSGFIIEENGLILTNAHVVANKPHSRVEVKLLNGKVYPGVVENLDMKSDLATVRIQARQLPTIRLGNSSDVRPGEFVVAIGSPLTLSNTVTSGVISSTHRASDELGLRDKDMVYLQTDAPITFGNSGGPLVNLDGEAIGISSMKVTAGISFAIPSDYVKKFLADTRNKPTKISARKRYMGITMLSLTPQILNQMQQRHQPVPPDIKGGVLVWKVIIGSPAHNAGLQPGDIVTHIDGNMITSSDDIYNVLNSSSNNIKSLRMTVRRGEAYNQETVLFVTPEIIE